MTERDYHENQLVWSGTTNRVTQTLETEYGQIKLYLLIVSLNLLNR